MTNDEIREFAKKVSLLDGPDEAARLLGVSRDTAMSLALGLRVRPKTYETARSRLAAQPANTGKK